MNSYEGEKTALQKELATLTSKLVDAKSAIYDLEEDNVGIFSTEAFIMMGSFPFQNNPIYLGLSCKIDLNAADKKE